ncbi:TPA: rod shape-determining protein MreD, partial [Legionella pneumophila subsp. pneumophila]|nr:rod shape-determining protein MreD [Legionella pneumophila subsp. pneumophila]
IIIFIDALLGFNYNLIMPVTSAILGMIIWPWIRVLGYSSLLTRSVYR